MKSLVHTEEVCSRSVPLSMLLEQNPSCVPALKGLCDEMCRNLIKIQSLGTASKLRDIFVSHEAVIFSFASNFLCSKDNLHCE